MELPDKIFLAGFMGTGKTEVGKALAQQLGYEFVDTDSIVENLTHKSIPEIFAEEGETSFRRWEVKAIDQALGKSQAVVALGGGAVCSTTNRKKINRQGPLILLTASVETLLRRLKGKNNRPLLQVNDPKSEMLRLMEKRAIHYQAIPWKLPTEGQTPAQLARQIQRELSLHDSALRVLLGERSYPLYFQKSAENYLNSLLKQHCPAERVVLITNTTVDRLYGRLYAKKLRQAFQVKKIVLPDGERYKTLKTVQGLYPELVNFKVDRKTPLVALGGGVLGDIVGFAAASYLRGVPFVQVPTTLLAQVDSSIGGKTGVDLPQGKNLVGAFYQPRFVLIDEGVLATLSPRQFLCGMAEVIKYAAIFDRKLFRTLETEMDDFLQQGGKGLEAVIRRCCEWKAWVVEKDELETKGIRSKLNFGHTLGHAIESLTHYRQYTHGEAIAMGMSFAGDGSQKKAGLAAREVRRLKALLEKTGLPTRHPPFKKADYRRVLTQDKKRVSGQVNFVYLKKIGESVVIPTSLEELTSWL